MGLTNTPRQHSKQRYRQGLSIYLYIMPPIFGSPSIASLPILIVFLSTIIQSTTSKHTWDAPKDIWSKLVSDCNFSDIKNSSSCHGVKMVKTIVQQLLDVSNKKSNIEILDGVNIVDVRDEFNRNARAMKNSDTVASVVQFFKDRELRIKLPNLLPTNFLKAFQTSLPSVQEGRGKNKGGGGGGGNGHMMMALMMGKMMAALGFGGLSMLAMKALMVSAMALMLSLIVAAKKLAGGGESEHAHVVYAQEHHHRRKRSLSDLPYRAYIQRAKLQRHY